MQTEKKSCLYLYSKTPFKKGNRKRKSGNKKKLEGIYASRYRLTDHEDKIKIGESCEHRKICKQ